MSLYSGRVRSKTGCLTCKQRRKKCDETRPVCERCTKAGMDCLGYSYLEDTGYKPARRRPKTAARLADARTGARTPEPGSSTLGLSLPSNHAVLATRAPDLEILSQPPVPSQSSLTLPILSVTQDDGLPTADEQLQALLSELSPNLMLNDNAFEFSFLSSGQSNSPFSQLDGDTGGRGTTDLTLGAPDNLDSGRHLAESNGLTFTTAIDRALDGLSTTANAHRLLMPQHVGPDTAPDRSRAMTSGQASLFDSLSSLGSSAAQPSLAASPSSSTIPACFQASAWPSPNAKDNDEDSATSEESDLEGFKDIVLSTPALDSSVESNSLPFILQSYANWLTRTVYEPLKLVHAFRGWITGRYIHSDDSRVSLMLFAKLLDKMWSKGASAVDYMPAASVLGQRIRYRAIEAGLTLTSRNHTEMTRALDEAVEMIHIRCFTSPMTSFIELITSTAPLFRLACPEPPHEAIDLAAMLVYPQVSLRHFASIDVVTSTVLSRPMLFRYHVHYDRALFSGILAVKDLGLQWLNGVPDQIILILARMNMLRDDFALPIDASVVAEIEQELREFKSSPGPTTDAYLMVARLGVQECWRLATFIYLYMGLCGANAGDSRVEKVQKSFVRLLERIKPGRTPDSFLIPPMLLIGVATHRECERNLIHQRMLGLRECATIGTCGHDTVRILEDIWGRTSAEGRPAVWSDLRISCARVLGL